MPNRKLTSAEYRAKFRSKIVVGKPDECWLWVGGMSSNGYGAAYLESQKLISSHRAAWIVANGEIPDGLAVLHRCDNKRCCNPAHLFLGTYGENNTDRSQKGRSCRGSQSHHAKLTESQVADIRKRYVRGHIKWPGRGNAKRLAAEYGISHTNLLDIIHGKIWKHVT